METQNKLHNIYLTLADKTSYDEIKKYLIENDTVFQITKQFLRSVKNMKCFSGQTVDTNFKSLMQLNDLEAEFQAVSVPGNGNCFFNSLSLMYFGNFEYFYIFKICSIYAFIENETIIEDFLINNAEYTHEEYLECIEKAVKINEWSDFISIISAVILLKKSISIVSIDNNLPSKIVYNIPGESTSLLIGFQNFHFVPILKNNDQVIEPNNLAMTVFDDFQRFAVNT